MKARLILEDGSSFEGLSIEVEGERIGEVVLNTAVVGYQEVMTDPANAGKILVLTYPLIGNYGVSGKFYESEKCWIEALLIKEKSRIYSNWQAEDSFDNFLKKENILALNEVDTRTLAVTIRDKGEMLGIVSTENGNKSKLLQKLRNKKKNLRKEFIKNISVKEVREIRGDPSGPSIAILDLGILNSFIKQLKTLGCNLTLLPYDTDAETILKMKIDGLIISGGPEEDASVPKITETVQKLLGRISMLGISTGCEIIALALGGKRKRMKIGHHGVNYPVKSPDSYKGYITVQNHSFVIDEDSLKERKEVSVTLRNINDNSIEEVVSESLRFISTQYYPSSGGFDEVHPVFLRFLRFLKMATVKKGAK